MGRTEGPESYDGSRQDKGMRIFHLNISHVLYDIAILLISLHANFLLLPFGALFFFSPFVSVCAVSLPF